MIRLGFTRAQLAKIGLPYQSGRSPDGAVGLCAKTEVGAGMGIDRNDRLYPDLEIAAHPDGARIDRAGRLPRQRPIVPIGY